MKHLAIFIGAAITCVLIAVANLVLDRLTGLNFFTFKLWFIIPVGAIAVGFAAASGGLLAARLFNAVPSWIDAALMVVLAAFTMFLIYYLDYSTAVLEDGRKVASLMGFSEYVDLLITTAHMRMGRGGQIDTGEVGQLGYWLAILEFVGFIVGGLCTYLFLIAMERCVECNTYLRKRKSVKTPELSLEQASTLLDHFKTGDLETIEQVIQWIPETHSDFAKKEKRAILTYELWGCPKCQHELVIAKPKVFTGSEWKDADDLKISRNLGPGLTLAASFR